MEHQLVIREGLGRESHEFAWVAILIKRRTTPPLLNLFLVRISHSCHKIIFVENIENATSPCVLQLIDTK